MATSVAAFGQPYGEPTAPYAYPDSEPYPGSGQYYQAPQPRYYRTRDVEPRHQSQWRMMLGLVGGPVGLRRPEPIGALGLNLVKGFQTGAVFVYGDYTLAALMRDTSAGETQDYLGALHRFSANIRLNAGGVASGTGALTWFAEAGLGRNYYRFSDQDTIKVNDMSLGLGFTATVNMGRKTMAFEWFVRGIVSPAEQLEAFVPCGNCSGSDNIVTILAGFRFGKGRLR